MNESDGITSSQSNVRSNSTVNWLSRTVNTIKEAANNTINRTKVN